MFLNSYEFANYTYLYFPHKPTSDSLKRKNKIIKDYEIDIAEILFGYYPIKNISKIPVLFFNENHNKVKYKAARVKI